MKKLLLLVLCLPFILTSCKKELPEPEIAEIAYGEIPFIKVGNYWRYESYNGFTGSYGTLEMTIIGTLASNPNIYEVQMNENGTLRTQYWYGMESGFVMIYDEFDENEYYADPVYDITNEIGDSWNGVDRSTGTQYIYTVTDQLVTIWVPFGTFVTTELDVDSPTQLIFQSNYWNDEIGLIRISNLGISYELDSAYIQ